MAQQSHKRSIRDVMEALHGVEICTGPDGVKYKKVHYPRICVQLENLDIEEAGVPTVKKLKPGIPMADVTLYVKKQKGNHLFLCLEDPRAKETPQSKRYMCPYCEFMPPSGHRTQVYRHMNGQKGRKIACAKRIQEEPDITKKAKKEPIEVLDDQTD